MKLINSNKISSRGIKTFLWIIVGCLGYLPMSAQKISSNHPDETENTQKVITNSKNNTSTKSVDEISEPTKVQQSNSIPSDKSNATKSIDEFLDDNIPSSFKQAGKDAEEKAKSLTTEIPVTKEETVKTPEVDLAAPSVEEAQDGSVEKASTDPKVIDANGDGKIDNPTTSPVSQEKVKTTNTKEIDADGDGQLDNIVPSKKVKNN